jgi:hypothetical protein
MPRGLIPLRLILLLQFTTAFALVQPAHESRLASPPNQPEALVSRLYKEVVARHPYGPLTGAEMKPFAPYLSKALRQRNDVALACLKDWGRQLPPGSPAMKPPSQWEDVGLFTGGDERGEPTEFSIERTQSEKDGSFRVYVRLTLRSPVESPFIWRVAAVVVQEDGHSAVDDVIYLKDEDHPREERLSKVISSGCDGPRWVGHRHE